MKFSKTVSSSRRTNRRKHFQASSGRRRILMSARLNKDLRRRYNVRSVPIRKNDTVVVDGGQYAEKTGKVIKVYRLKWKIYVDQVFRKKANGDQVHVGLHPSNVTITGLAQGVVDRKAMLERKGKARAKTQDKYKNVAQMDD
eukprot:Selendium_serpulae@DN2280_c0_g1_i1.p1